MKSQKHNLGPLKNLNVDIEQDVVEKMIQMAQKTAQPLESLVVVALKRYISHHCDYLKDEPIL